MLIIPDTLLNEIINEVINRWLIPKFNELGMNATGEWLKNIEVETYGDNTAEIWARHYTEQLVYGRKPGKMPPVEPLIQWVVAKFGYEYNTAEKFAWAIAKKIAAEGTDYYKEGGTDLIEVLSQPEVTDYVNSRVGNYLQSEAQLQIVRDLKEAFA